MASQWTFTLSVLLKLCKTNSDVCTWLVKTEKIQALGHIFILFSISIYFFCQARICRETFSWQEKTLDSPLFCASSHQILKTAARTECTVFKTELNSLGHFSYVYFSYFRVRSFHLEKCDGKLSKTSFFSDWCVVKVCESEVCSGACVHQCAFDKESLRM